MDAIIFFGCALLAGTAAVLGGRSLFRRGREFRNPLEWSLKDRALLMVVLYLGFCGVVGFFGGIRMLIQVSHVPWVNPEFWPGARPYLVLFTLALVILYLAGSRLRRQSPDHEVYVHVVVQFTALVMAMICYVLGPVTDPRGFLIGLAQTVLNFVLFGPAFTLPWLMTYVLLVVTAMASVWLHLIPYAPFFVMSEAGWGQVTGGYWISLFAQIAMIYLLLALLVAYVTGRWRDRESRLAEMTDLLKKMFGRYLSTEVMHSLIADPAALELGGQRRAVTIMMTDLRGFTALSERLSPEQVVQMLNAYFEVMVDVIFKFQGTINEFIGDALLVIFGAPQEMPDRAARAVACAIAMQNAMAEVNRQNRIMGLPELEMGIGLNDGEVIVGNIGSTKRSTYTVIGSGVNLASRIESYTVGGQILVSESVRRLAGHLLRIDGETVVRPKGAAEALAIYQVGGIAGDYNLVIEEPEPPLVLLNHPLAMRYAVLEGKHVDQGGLTGTLVRLSPKSATIMLKEPLEPHTNLKMNLISPNREIMQSDFYGKIVDISEENYLLAMVRFSALPPRIESYFHAAMEQTMDV